MADLKHLIAISYDNDGNKHETIVPLSYTANIRSNPPMSNEVTLELLPGVKIVIDTDKFNIEGNFSLGGFSEGADLKVYLDLRIVDVISKEQSKTESIVILRTK